MSIITTPDILEDVDYCPVSATHKHEPDLNSLKIEHDGDTAYIDVNCARCGRSGCAAKFDEEQVTW